MAEPLATISDLTERLGRELTTTETRRAPSLLVEASASVRRYARQDFALAETTDRIKVSSKCLIRLPQRPVVSITSVLTVTDDPAVAVPYTWDGLDELYVWDNIGAINATLPRWRRKPVVDVTYEHGYEPDEMPDDVIGIVCQVTARALGRKPDEAGYTSETVPDYAYTLNARVAGGPFALLDDEKETLEPYRRPAGPIRTSR